MRPMGVVLISLYHFLAATFLSILAIALTVGGSFLGAMFSGSNNSPLWGLGRFVGIVGPASPWALPWLLSLLAMAYGRVASGDAFYASCLIKIALHVAIICYLIQPQVRSVFQPAAPAPPRI